MNAVQDIVRFVISGYKYRRKHNNIPNAIFPYFVGEQKYLYECILLHRHEYIFSTR